MKTIKYNWGFDGKGRAHMYIDNDMTVIFCMFDGGGQMGVWLLESQDIDDMFNEN